jgi:hypothetical protein
MRAVRWSRSGPSTPTPSVECISLSVGAITVFLLHRREILSYPIVKEPP